MRLKIKIYVYDDFLGKRSRTMFFIFITIKNAHKNKKSTNVMIFLGKRSRNDSALCIPPRRALPGALKITYEIKNILFSSFHHI
jgi:hypothetical protein